MYIPVYESHHKFCITGYSLAQSARASVSYARDRLAFSADVPVLSCILHRTYARGEVLVHKHNEERASLLLAYVPLRPPEFELNV